MVVSKWQKKMACQVFFFAQMEKRPLKCPKRQFAKRNDRSPNWQKKSFFFAIFLYRQNN